MPNRACNAAPVKMEGAILLGDAWNTRHPLTGSGMSVCLRDVELLTRALQGVDVTNSKVRTAERFVVAFVRCCLCC